MVKSGAFFSTSAPSWNPTVINSPLTMGLMVTLSEASMAPKAASSMGTSCNRAAAVTTRALGMDRFFSSLPDEQAERARTRRQRPANRK